MTRVLVIGLSEAFGRLWQDLSADLGIAIDVAPAAQPGPPPADAAAVILAAGGAERAALQWLEEHPLVPGPPAFVVGADPGRRIATQVVARGARDYFALPDDLEVLRNAVVAAVKNRPAQMATPVPDEGMAAFAGIVGESTALRRELARAARILPHRTAHVLILGETGTGKEVLARSIHAGGPRRNAPFVPINCSALPEHLIESELFGHERGSFTDAHAAKPGLFEVADGGTLFLDEIGDLPAGVQAKLLRVLDDHEIRRVGGTKSRTVDVRIVAATHENLPSKVRAGTFREDLFFRLSTLVITLPPLRERADDVILIAQALVRQLASEHGVAVPTLSAEVQRQLRAHPWPGNVRQLKNAVERALLLSAPGELRVEELLIPAEGQLTNPAPFPFPAPLREIMIAVAHATVRWFGGNRSESARQLGISTKRLRRLLNGSGLDGDADESEPDGASWTTPGPERPEGRGARLRLRQ
jgi:DNA-binding NtrC family response regulator